jgi:DNA-binding MarR family transcriptional regulator
MGTAEEVRWLDADEQHAWRAYLLGVRRLERALDRDLRRYGTQLSEYEIISMLSEQPTSSMRMSALADLVVQSRSRLTHTAARLEQRGWVSRSPADEDRRGVNLTLTETGARFVAELAPHHVESVRRHLCDVLGRADLIALGQLMDRVSDPLAEDDR